LYCLLIAMANTSASRSSKTRAVANLALSFDSSFYDVARVLRKGSGTVPFYDPGYILKMGASLFEGCTVMNGYFLAPVLLCKPETLDFGDKRIEPPFHCLDCGVCLLLASLVKEVLCSEFYHHEDFVKIHDNVSRHLQINQSVSGEDLPESDLASFKYVKLNGKTVWVVQAYKCYSAALASGSPWCDKVKPATKRRAPQPHLLAEVPLYVEVSGPISSTPEKDVVRKKKRKKVSSEASGQDGQKEVPPSTTRMIKPLCGVLDDCDSD